MLIQDNQQVTASWISAIIEGEGTFVKKTHGDYHIQFCNTDLDIISNCEKFLYLNGIWYSKYQDSRKRNKTLYTIKIVSHECWKLYRILKPYSQCRIDEWEKLVGTSENTRDTSLSIDIQWLIGIYEAEGSISMSLSCKQVITPVIILVNTNMLIIEKVMNNLKAINCPFHAKKYEPTIYKPYMRITLSGLGKCLKFLDKTQNLWISKRNQQRSNLLQEYIRSRLNVFHHKAPYTEREIQIYNIMKQLNK